MNISFPFCEVCGSREKPLRCAQCKKVWYCNTQHQADAWPSHRKFCQEERRRQLQLLEEENNKKLQLQQSTSNSNDTACLDFVSEFPDISALLEDNNIKIPDDIDLEKLLTEISSDVLDTETQLEPQQVPPQPQLQPQVQLQLQPQFNSFHIKGGGENCYLPTEFPPFAL